MGTMPVLPEIMKSGELHPAPNAQKYAIRIMFGYFIGVNGLGGSIVLAKFTSGIFSCGAGSGDSGDGEGHALCGTKRHTVAACAFQSTIFILFS